MPWTNEESEFSFDLVRYELKKTANYQWHGCQQHQGVRTVFIWISWISFQFIMQILKWLFIRSIHRFGKMYRNFNPQRKHTQRLSNCNFSIKNNYYYHEWRKKRKWLVAVANHFQFELTLIFYAIHLKSNDGRFLHPFSVNEFACCLAFYWK